MTGLEDEKTLSKMARKNLSSERKIKMNQGQEQFFNFILERVQDGKQEDARALLSESFAKQADGSFNREYLESFNPRMIAILKPECIEEVRTIMQGFAQNMNRETNT